jgi:hypothetical protein
MHTPEALAKWSSVATARRERDEALRSGNSRSE